MICTNCKKDKPEDQFVMEKRNKLRLRKSWCKECQYAATEVWRSKNKTKIDGYEFEYGLFRRYGITLDYYNIILARQGNKCAICGWPDGVVGKQGKEGKLHVDHDHKTNQIRGLVCGSCNIGIGLLGDDRDRVFAAAHYLDVYKEGMRAIPFE